MKGGSLNSSALVSIRLLVDDSSRAGLALAPRLLKASDNATTTSTTDLMKLAKVGKPFPFGAPKGPDERQGDTKIENGS